MKNFYLNLDRLYERCGGKDNKKSSVAAFPLWSRQKRKVDP